MKNSTFASLRTPEYPLAAEAEPLYPRPALVRDSFLSLDGLWDFSAEKSGAAPRYHERIRVPFPPESALSEIERSMPDGTLLCYRRTFTLPEGFCRGRVLLHFGAVDQEAEVSLNGRALGKHIGGYHPFSFDITDTLVTGENVLTVTAIDRLDTHILPYGKQRHKRGGMWYTPISGIWQSVWLESVPACYIKSLDIKADANGATIRAEGVDEGLLIVRSENHLFCEKMRKGEVRINLPKPRLWSPEDPYLYRFTLQCGEDTVSSYFACRTLSVAEVGGVPRILLNGKPYFFHALLDQGYFPDGILTPAHPSCYEHDILFAKSLGFNTLRKHIKIEPQQFYYDCDRLGMIVFQDMVNNSDYSFLRDTAFPTLFGKRRNDKRLHRNKKSRAAFLTAMEETVTLLKNHPCVCYWTIFNEGWGQFDSAAAYEHLRALDDTRIIDAASGWFTPTRSDVTSPHIYFKPVRLTPSEKPIILSEFGGYSLPVKGHIFNENRVYGYRKFEDAEAFSKALATLYREEVLPAVKAGLCGAVYTQLSDVEDEINGLITYDRQVEKLPCDEMLAIATALQAAINA